MPVSDKEARASLNQLPDRLLDLLLRQAIYVAGGFIENLTLIEIAGNTSLFYNLLHYFGLKSDMK